VFLDVIVPYFMEQERKKLIVFMVLCHIRYGKYAYRTLAQYHASSFSKATRTIYPGLNPSKVGIFHGVTVCHIIIHMRFIGKDVLVYHGFGRFLPLSLDCGSNGGFMKYHVF
jgi:hypothetical protein